MTVEYAIPDDYGTLVYFDFDGEIVECDGCQSSFDHPFHGSCGDCFGGTEHDPYVNGSAYGWRDMPIDTLAWQALEPWERAWPN